MNHPTALLSFPLTAFLGALAFGGPAEAGAGPPADLERVVRKAIERAQRDLEKDLELWQDHTSWSDPWRVQTEHYEVSTTRSRSLGLEVAQGLETMLGNFQRVLGTDHVPPQPFKIFVFPTLQEYNAFGDQFGAEHSSFIGSFHATQSPDQPVGTYYNINHTLLNMWITHSAFHQFTASAFPNAAPPAGVAEGLACYFASFWDYDYTVSELERLKNSQFEKDWIPLPELLSTPVAQYGDRFHNRDVLLAMLMTYLRVFRDDTATVLDDERRTVQAAFEEYVQLVYRGQDPSMHPVHDLLNEGLAELEADFRAHAFR